MIGCAECNKRVEIKEGSVCTKCYACKNCCCCNISEELKNLPKPKNFFVITKDGKFSAGGIYPSFKSIPKFWNKRGLSGHLAQNYFKKTYKAARAGKKHYEDAFIIEYELVPKRIMRVKDWHEKKNE